MPRQDPAYRKSATTRLNAKRSSAAGLNARAKAASSELAAISKAAGRERAAAVVVALCDAVLARSGHGNSQQPAPTRAIAKAAQLQAEVTELQKRWDKTPRPARGVLRVFGDSDV